MVPSLSQVLLTDEHWRQRCAATVPEDEFGVEWAAGRGALTELLSETWEYLLALELDASFCRELRRFYPADRVGVVRTDITNYPLPKRKQPYSVVGNLPYHLTGPLLEKLARESGRFRQFFGLVQWEVARRIDAEPGDSEYRSISVLMNWVFEVTLVDKVPRTAFSPEPEVDSAWIRLEPRRINRPVGDVSSFLKVIFQQPRKTLLNNLAASTGEKKHWKEWMSERDWATNRRPGSLTLSDAREVYDHWIKRR